MKKNFIKIAMGVLFVVMAGIFTGCSNPGSSNGKPDGYWEYLGLEPELSINGHWVFVEADFDDYTVTYDPTSPTVGMLVTVSFSKEVEHYYIFNPLDGENLDSVYIHGLNQVAGGTYEYVFEMPDNDVVVHLEKKSVQNK